MNDHISYSVLILVVFTTSLNRGEKINGLISKFNERRAAGILAQPRVGRTTGMSNFARLDTVAGLVHYPRVGRSGSFSPFVNFYRNTPIEIEEIPELLDHDETGIPSLMSLGYQKQRHSRILAKNRRWVEQSRYGTFRGDEQHSRLHHCTDRTIEGALSFAPSKDSAQLEEQSAHNHMTGLTREIHQTRQNIVS